MTQSVKDKARIITRTDVIGCRLCHARSQLWGRVGGNVNHDPMDWPSLRLRTEPNVTADLDAIRVLRLKMLGRGPAVYFQGIQPAQSRLSDNRKSLSNPNHSVLKGCIRVNEVSSNPRNPTKQGRRDNEVRPVLSRCINHSPRVGVIPVIPCPGVVIPPDGRCLHVRGKRLEAFRAVHERGSGPLTGWESFGMLPSGRSYTVRME